MQEFAWGRHIVFTRKQLPGKTNEYYVTDLCIRAKACDLEQLTDGLIKAWIIWGITDNQVKADWLAQEKLLAVNKIVTAPFGWKYFEINKEHTISVNPRS